MDLYKEFRDGLSRPHIAYYRRLPCHNMQPFRQLEFAAHRSIKVFLLVRDA